MPFLYVVFYLIFLYGINAKVMMVSVKARAKILVVQLTHLGIKLLKKEKKEKKKGTKTHDTNGPVEQPLQFSQLKAQDPSLGPPNDMSINLLRKLIRLLPN